MIRLLTQQEMHTIYPQLFFDIFGYYDDNQIPSTVIVSESEHDNVIKSFISGRLTSKDTFYIQYSGALVSFISSRKAWHETEVLLFNTGIRFIICTVENINKQANMILLKMNFVPYGIKATRGKLYLDWWKELKELE